MDAKIVIPVFNQVHFTKMCLDSLYKAGVKGQSILVIDNASTDETPRVLSGCPQISVIRNSENRFCAAWSQGAKIVAPASWTVVLNNDVLIPSGWLEGLVRFAEERGFDVVSPAMCEGEMDYDFDVYARQFMTKMANVYRGGIASGACFMVHRRVFDAIGYFDEDPKLGGYQDDEFFRRCRKNNFRLALTGCSFLHHFGSVTQKAVKTGLKQPNANLGDRDYYRKKYGLTRFKRKREQWQRNLSNVWWRLSERFHYQSTLLSVRQNGQFVWR